ncbi:hypothetical protein CCACVL1_12120 [Corchorus capsularis]|uniref:Uncharacterized protein n=1 Tax=Corchorus capsularis TaxID=210143 RepID=A0A1R3IHB5_COCAP|nr:hypothetical protein CCACVL1_12120 [Corchorus capsularis]
MGLRKTQKTNVALLAKTGWRLHTRDQSLCTKVFQKKYLKGRNFVHAVKTSGASSTWRGLLQTKECIRRGTRWRLGNGSDIRFWTDWWVGQKPLIEIGQGSISLEDRNVLVSSFIDQNGEWELDSVTALLPASIIEEIRAVPFFVSALEGDRFVWGWDKIGQFSSSSAYGALMNFGLEVEWRRRCSWIWRLPVPERVRFFCWLLFMKSLNTLEMLHRKGIVGDPVCRLCSGDVESIEHVFRLCPFVRGIWECVGQKFGIDTAGVQSFEDWFHLHEQIIAYAEKLTKEVGQVFFVGKRPNDASSCLISWQLLPAGCYLLNSDGSRRHLDNQASARGLVRDASVVVQFLQQNMMNSHPCYTLVRDCLELIKGDWIVEIRHIFREGNRCADCLASLAHEAEKGLTIYNEPPQQLLPLLQDDRTLRALKVSGLHSSMDEEGTEQQWDASQGPMSAPPLGYVGEFGLEAGTRRSLNKASFLMDTKNEDSPCAASFQEAPSSKLSGPEQMGEKQIGPPSEEICNLVPQVELTEQSSNPGAAGSGGTIRDDQGNWIVGYARNIGDATSLQAEFWGLRDGLRLAFTKGIQNLDVNVDASLVINLIENADISIHPLGNIISDCRSLMQNFHNVKISHCYREGNMAADALANKGRMLDEHFVVFNDIPDFIYDFVMADYLGVSFPRLVNIDL